MLHRYFYQILFYHILHNYSQGNQINFLLYYPQNLFQNFHSHTILQIHNLHKFSQQDLSILVCLKRLHLFCNIYGSYNNVLRLQRLHRIRFYFQLNHNKYILYLQNLLFHILYSKLLVKRVKHYISSNHLHHHHRMRTWLIHIVWNYQFHQLHIHMDRNNLVFYKTHFHMQFFCFPILLNKQLMQQFYLNSIHNLLVSLIHLL